MSAMSRLDLAIREQANDICNVCLAENCLDCIMYVEFEGKIVIIDGITHKILEVRDGKAQSVSNTQVNQTSCP